MEDREYEVKLFMENQKLKSEVERLKKYHAISEMIDSLREIALSNAAKITTERRLSEFGDFLETIMHLAEEVGYDDCDLVNGILHHTSNDVRDDILTNLKQWQETGKLP